MASKLQSPLLLVLRLYWGWQFFVTGWGKLHHIDRATAFFQSLGIPFPMFNVYINSSIECLCGLLLVIGLIARAAAIPLIINMIVAYVTADWEKVKHLFDDPDKFVTATPFLFLLVSVIILAFGPGFFSLDCLICYFRKKES